MRTADFIGYPHSGELDEIFGVGHTHLERLSNNTWFLLIGHEDGSETALWFTSKDLPTLMERRPPRGQ